MHAWRRERASSWEDSLGNRGGSPENRGGSLENHGVTRDVILRCFFVSFSYYALRRRHNSAYSELQSAYSSPDRVMAGAAGTFGSMPVRGAVTAATPSAWRALPSSPKPSRGEHRRAALPALAKGVRGGAGAGPG